MKKLSNLKKIMDNSMKTSESVNLKIYEKNKFLKP